VPETKQKQYGFPTVPIISYFKSAPVLMRRRCQQTENTRFSNNFKVTQSCEAMTSLFDGNFPPRSIIFIAHAEFVIVNGVML